jgi:serine/threonine protein kinase
VKILEKEKIKDKKDVERITREIKILKKVRHPNVIQLYEVSKFTKSGTSIDDQSCIKYILILTLKLDN